MMSNNFLKQGIEMPADIPAMRNSGRDFRIHANSSRTSFGGESNTAKPLNRLPKQRTTLIGANKPHTLKNQNDSIRHMLKGGIGSKPSLEPIDPNKVRSIRQNSVRASQSSLNKDKIIGQSPGLTPSLQASEKFDQTIIGGTPDKRSTNKGGNMPRMTGRSVGRFGATSKMGGSTSNFDNQSLKSGSVRGNPNDDSFDLEDIDDLIEKIKLESAIEDKRREIRKVKN